jgi:hypothetical protein
MREMKFRAWHKQHKEWEFFTFEQLLTVGTRIDYFELEHWCQWTGLLDKNGKEIYGGDGFVYRGGDPRIQKSTVIFAHGAFGFNANKSNIILNDGRLIEIEIIGNIYENPDYANKITPST